MDYLRSDAMLMEILQESKTITGFLDAVFGFLRRNTDFYHVKRNPNEKIGFAKGLREKIVFGTMQSYDPDCTLNNLTAECTSADGVYAPPAVDEVEIASEEIKIDLEDCDDAQKTKDIVAETSEGKFKDNNFLTADFKNGACFPNYCWSQTLRDVELHVKLPTNFKNSKQLSIEIKPDEISVRSRIDPNNVIITGKIGYRFKHNDAVWTISEGKLSISLDKTMEVWWERFFSTENVIDVKKIDVERYIDELPEDSQAAIHKLRVQQMEQVCLNEERAVLDNGKETMERLRTAWDAEGSPFKGQPFDPAMVKFS